MPRGKPFGHVFRQGTAERAHAFEPDRPTIAAVGRGREEEQSAAAFAPERDDLRQPVGRGVMSLVNEQGLAGEVVGQVVGREAVQGRMGAGEGVVERAPVA